MRKLISTLTLLCVLGLTAQPAFSITGPHNNVTGAKDKDGNGKQLSIGSNRQSGDLQLYFTAGKEGDAVISIINESGKTVLQQTSKVTANINTIVLKNAPGLADGSYTVSLVSNKKIYTTKFVIWK